MVLLPLGKAALLLGCGRLRLGYCRLKPVALCPVALALGSQPGKLLLVLGPGVGEGVLELREVAEQPLALGGSGRLGLGERGLELLGLGAQPVPLLGSGAGGGEALERFIQLRLEPVAMGGEGVLFGGMPFLRVREPRALRRRPSSRLPRAWSRGARAPRSLRHAPPGAVRGLRCVGSLHR